MKNKKYLIFLLVILTVTNPMFAKKNKNKTNNTETSQPAEVPYTMDSSVLNDNTVVTLSLKKILGTIITIIGSIYVKILAIACFCMLAIRLIINKNKQEFGKKFYAAMIGCLLVTFTPDLLLNIFEISSSVHDLAIYSIFQTPSFTESTKSESESQTKTNTSNTDSNVKNPGNTVPEQTPEQKALDDFKKMTDKEKVDYLKSGISDKELTNILDNLTLEEKQDLLNTLNEKDTKTTSKPVDNKNDYKDFLEKASQTAYTFNERGDPIYPFKEIQEHWEYGQRGEVVLPVEVHGDESGDGKLSFFTDKTFRTVKTMRGTVYASCLNDDGTVSLYVLIGGIPVEINSFAGTDLYDPDIEYLMWGNDFESNKKTSGQKKSDKAEDIFEMLIIDEEGNKSKYNP